MIVKIHFLHSFAHRLTHAKQSKLYVTPRTCRFTLFQAFRRYGWTSSPLLIKNVTPDQF